MTRKASCIVRVGGTFLKTSAIAVEQRHRGSHQEESSERAKAQIERHQELLPEQEIKPADVCPKPGQELYYVTRIHVMLSCYQSHFVTQCSLSDVSENLAILL
jgi:hypothetical protein